jgi:hypothetical protein
VQTENTRCYQATFGESRRVRQKGERFKPAMRHALTALHGARAFSHLGAEHAIKREHGSGSKAGTEENLQEGEGGKQEQ